jgi:RHS repeat-associated protein
MQFVRDQFDYTYDAAGNRLSRDIPSSLYATNNRDQVYTYDSLHRLATYDEGTKSGTSISGTPTKEQDWTLDQLGNWTVWTNKSGGSTTLAQFRTHNSVNEIDNDNNDANTPSVATITASTGTNWADPIYDKAGNMTALPYIGNLASNLDLTYDAWNRLVKVMGGPATLLANEYDGLGRVIQKGNQSPPNVDVYYNGQWQILEERVDGDSDPKNQYAWHPYYIDALAIRWYDANVNGEFDEESDEGMYYALHDANFNVTAMADTNGGVKERYAYSPYGEVTFLNASFGAGGNAIEQTHLYTGRERDAETGLQLNRHRFYAAHLGRWLHRDPIGYEGSPYNLYEYVSSQPTYWTDAHGWQGRGPWRTCAGQRYRPGGRLRCCSWSGSGGRRQVGLYDPKTQCCSGSSGIGNMPCPEPMCVFTAPACVPVSPEEQDSRHTPGGCDAIESSLFDLAQERAKSGGCEFISNEGIHDWNSQLVEATANNRCVGRLEIRGHGNSETFLVGSVGAEGCKCSSRVFTPDDIRRMISGVRFCPQCHIILHHCGIGQNTGLIDALGRLTGCSVTSFTGKKRWDLEPGERPGPGESPGDWITR